MHRPVQPLPEWEVAPSQSHPDRLPLQNVRSSTDPCRYKMVSEVGSVHSDSVSLNRKEAATALASMRGPLVDLESPHMDGGKTCDYESPVHGDLLTWEKADMLHRRRSSPDPTNYSNITPHVTAPKVDNGASANDINQLTQMMSHLSKYGGLCSSFENRKSSIFPRQLIVCRWQYRVYLQSQKPSVCRIQAVSTTKGNRPTRCIVFPPVGRTS